MFYFEKQIAAPATFKINIFNPRPGAWQLHIYFRGYQVYNCGPFNNPDEAREAAKEYIAGSNA